MRAHLGRGERLRARNGCQMVEILTNCGAVSRGQLPRCRRATSTLTAGQATVTVLDAHSKNGRVKALFRVCPVSVSGRIRRLNCATQGGPICVAGQVLRGRVCKGQLVSRERGHVVN